MFSHISDILHGLYNKCLTIPALNFLTNKGFNAFEMNFGIFAVSIIFIVTVTLTISFGCTSEKRCKKKLCGFFHISGLRNFRVCRVGGPKDKYYTFEHQNHFRLNSPRWKYSLEDGSKDINKKRNKLIYPESILWLFAGRSVYVVRTKNVWDMVSLVHKLRCNGQVILPCSQELEKQERLSSEKKNSDEVIRDVIEVLKGDSSQFTVLCKECLIRKGSNVTDMPKNNIGADLFVKQKDKVYVTKCLLTARETLTGMEALKQFKQLVNKTFANSCMLITTGKITYAAAQFAQQEGFIIIDNDALVELLDTSPVVEKGKEFLQWELMDKDIESMIP